MNDLRRPAAPFAVAALFLLTTAITGCGSSSGKGGGGDGEKTPSGKDRSASMKALDAAQRLDELLDDTTTAIRPKLKWRDGSTEVLQRNDAALNEPNGEATVSKTRYVRTKVSPAKLDRLLKSVADRWKESGYEVKDTAPKQPGFAGRAPDGFSVRCAVGGSGNIYFDAASSAVEDPGYSGTVPGEKGDRIPKDPDGYPLLKPDVTDPYWSA